MRYGYIVALLILMVSIIYCMYRCTKEKGMLAVSEGKLLFAGAFSVFMQILYACSTNEFVSTLFFGWFTASLDFTLLFLLEYTCIYTGNKEMPKKLKRALLGLAFLEDASFLLNAIFHHVYRLEEIAVSGMPMFVLKKFHILYCLHLTYAYILVAVSFGMLVFKAIRVSSFYKKKYTIILAIYMVVLILDMVTLCLKLPFNISVVFYGWMAITIYYYSFRYQPKSLISNMIGLSVRELHTGIICYNDMEQCVYSNDRIWNMHPCGLDHDNVIQYYLGKIREQGDDKTLFTWGEEFEIEGRTRYIEITRKVLRDSKQNLVGYCFITEDRTEQIQGYLDEVELANKENQKKSEFLSRVSHEIRTPINAIYGMTEMILRESKEQEILEYAEEIKSSSQLLIGIINDVLDFSRIEAGKMAIVEKEYSTKELLNNVVSMIKPRAVSKGLQLQVEVSEQLPKSLYGDRMRIEQIIINLMTNAVKYTEKGSVLMGVSFEKEDEEQIALRVEVKDTGIGIKKEDFSKLLTAFERLDETKNHSIQGTGLGLNITNLLLDLMHSSLKVESEYGKGSTFSFVLKQKVMDASPMGSLTDHPVREQKKYEAVFTAPDARVLMVDDNMANRMVFKKLLHRTQVQITDVDSGRKCLEQVAEHTFDLIFLDHMMPEMDGVETFQKMKEMEHQCKDTPVIMLTANAIEGAKEQYLEIGFDDFLSKPILPKNLEEMMWKYLAK